MTAEPGWLNTEEALPVGTRTDPSAETDEQFAPVVYEKGLDGMARTLVHAIRREIRALVGPVEQHGRERYRAIHAHARQAALEKHRAWIEQNWDSLSQNFAEPQQVVPKKVIPKLMLVETQRQRDLFRLSRLTWSLPYSGGYGRRLNYLIWDDEHDKVMGVLGLQSPPLSFPARDRAYLVPFDLKPALVNQTMDAYVVGAVPPYSGLYGGKLAVLAAASRDVRLDYQRRYAGRVSRISQAVLPAELTAVTTLAAYGRSSMYGRVSKGTQNGRARWAAESLGPCVGWGTVQFSDELYEKMKQFHRLIAPERATHGFGTGPKVKQQIVKRVLRALRLPDEFVRHDVKREVYIIPHVTNLQTYLAGIDNKPEYDDEPFDVLAKHWMHRYCIPRSLQCCSVEGPGTVASRLGITLTGPESPTP